jgi:hypothetical protein
MSTECNSEYCIAKVKTKNVTRKLCKKAIAHGCTHTLTYLEYFTEDMFADIVKRRNVSDMGPIISKLPNYALTDTFYMKLIIAADHDIYDTTDRIGVHIIEKYLGKETYYKYCLMLLDKYGLKNVPHEKMTYDMCLTAVKKRPSDIKYIRKLYGHMPVEKSNEWICVLIDSDLTEITTLYKTAIEQDLTMIRYLPERVDIRRPRNTVYLDIFTPEMYNALVKQNGLYVKYIPPKYQTPELAALAIRSNSYAIRYLHPASGGSNDGWYKLCLLAIRLNPYCIDCISEECLYDNPYYIGQVRKALKTNGLVINRIPKGYLTEEMCIIAVKQNRHAAQYLTKEQLTKKVLDAIQGRYTHTFDIKFNDVFITFF